jgi:N-acetylglucosaminyl-diphospho-decaprenol L-rhamnosyltransferase
VVVVDNNSSDGTVEVVKKWVVSNPDGAALIQNSVNRGFAAAVNQGVQAAADADTILLLNPDARLLTGVDDLVEASRKFGLAAGRLVNSSGAVQTGFTIRRFPTAATLVCESLGINRLWPSNPVNRRYRYLDRDLTQPGMVEQPAGAFLMFRRDVWLRLGGFDERFHPVWFEDVDFCRRAIDSAYGICYLPNVLAEHDGGRSVSFLPNENRAMFWCVSLLRYASKHFTASRFRIVCAAVVLASLPRMVVGIVTERSLGPTRAYWKVIWVGVLSLFSAREPEPLRAR